MTFKIDAAELVSNVNVGARQSERDFLDSENLNIKLAADQSPLTSLSGTGLANIVPGAGGTPSGGVWDDLLGVGGDVVNFIGGIFTGDTGVTATGPIPVFIPTGLPGQLPEEPKSIAPVPRIMSMFNKNRLVVPVVAAVVLFMVFKK